MTFVIMMNLFQVTFLHMQFQTDFNIELFVTMLAFLNDPQVLRPHMIPQIPRIREGFLALVTLEFLLQVNNFVMSLQGHLGSVMVGTSMTLEFCFGRSKSIFLQQSIVLQSG